MTSEPQPAPAEPSVVSDKPTAAMAWAVYCLRGEYDYRVFHERTEAEDFAQEQVLEEGDEEMPVVPLVPAAGVEELRRAVMPMLQAMERVATGIVQYAIDDQLTEFGESWLSMTQAVRAALAQPEPGTNQPSDLTE